MKGELIAFLLLASCSLANADSGYFTLSGTIFQEVAEEFQIDPLLLYSVALTESATGAGGGNIHPFPYVTRTSDGAAFYKSESDAKEALAEILKYTNRVDIGMMQINLFYHPQEDPLSLLDPKTNLEVAANYLKQTLASTRDPILGVGRYHNWSDPQRANWYGQRVWQIYRNIQNIQTKGF